MTASAQRVAALALLLSGFSALAYEILWVRLFTHLIGGTILSISIVSSLFLAGLGLGYRLFGHYASRASSPWRLYARLEFFIAAWALLLPFTLDSLPALVDPLFVSLEGEHLLLKTVQLCLGLLLLLPPSVAIGGTVPVLLVPFRNDPIGPLLGRFYLINTAGGVAGLLLCVFVSIPLLGVQATVLVAIASNVAAALLALSQAGREKPEVFRPAEPGYGLSGGWIPRGVALLSGFAILSCEILWSRLFQLYLGNTIFAFALVLSVVLVALALGSSLFLRLYRRRPVVTTTLSQQVALLAIALTLPIWLYDKAAYLFQWAHQFAAGSWPLLLLSQWLLIFVLIGPACTLSGLLFPLTVQRYQAETNCDHASAAGTIGFWNCLGTVLGPLYATFAALPTVGLQTSFKSLASLALLTAGGMLVVCSSGNCRRQITHGIVGLALLGALWATPSWDEKLLHSGIYLYAPHYAGSGGLKANLGRYRLIYSHHGLESSVAVRENRAGERTLLVNGKADASSGRDMSTQYLLAHLPLLHHPNPASALVIGLGSGVTLGSAALYPLQQLEVVELSPSVVAASDYFQQENQSPLNDPRVKLSVEDGLYRLRIADSRFDIIISEPSNPWQLGNANLFSRDFYRIVRSRLAPGGIFCQWLPIYDLSPAALHSALRTFSEAFPSGWLFLNGGDLFILGSAQHNAPRPALLTPSRSLPDVYRQLQQIGLDRPADLYEHIYLYELATLNRALADVPVSTLDSPLLEYSGRDLLAAPVIAPYLEENRAFLTRLR